jgi:hypothetical protein
VRVLLLAAVTAVGTAAAPAPAFHARVTPLSPALRARMTGVSWHPGRARRRVPAALRRTRPNPPDGAVDAYGGSDFASIEADNTSAFNCRPVSGGGGWSQHAYGRAIDVNPIENPYVGASGKTEHRASRPYLDRTRRRPGMAWAGGALVTAFSARGWGWGGSWSGAKDFQHFSATGH